MVTLRSKNKIAALTQQRYAASRRQAFGFWRSQIDDQHDRSLGQRGCGKDANPPRFDPTSQNWRTTGHHDVTFECKIGLIICNQKCTQTDQPQGQRRFSRPGRPEDQHTPPIDRHATSVDPFADHTGKPTTKRAPRGSDVMSAWVGRMFSAQMTPPCASTICLDIARPSPE